MLSGESSSSVYNGSSLSSGVRGQIQRGCGHKLTILSSGEEIDSIFIHPHTHTGPGVLTRAIQPGYEDHMGSHYSHMTYASFQNSTAVPTIASSSKTTPPAIRPPTRAPKLSPEMTGAFVTAGDSCVANQVVTIVTGKRDTAARPGASITHHLDMRVERRVRTTDWNIGKLLQ